ELERDLALHGASLLGHEYCAHAALADLLQQLVRTDHRAGTFAWRPSTNGWTCGWPQLFKKNFRVVPSFQQRIDYSTPLRIASAGQRQIRVALGGRAQLQDRKCTRLNSSPQIISFAAFCLIDN